jgi:hypothetical protein
MGGGVHAAQLVVLLEFDVTVRRVVLPPRWCIHSPRSGWNWRFSWYFIERNLGNGD